MNIFATVGEELKRLRDELNYLTHQAIFGDTPEARQEAQRKAIAVNEEMQAKFTEIWTQAGDITDFVRSPGSGSLLVSVHGLLDIIERTSSKMGRGSLDSKQLVASANASISAA